jgi:hypothetical protein
MHGGKSTGPRTAEGLERSRRANWRHGRFSAAAKQEAKQLREFLRRCAEVLAKCQNAIAMWQAQSPKDGTPGLTLRGDMKPKESVISQLFVAARGGAE